MIFGHNGFSISPFSWSVPFDTTIDSIQMSNALIDEIKIDANLDIVDSIVKEDWSIDTMLLGEFKDNLEFGNVSLSGMEIQKLKIKRRLSASLTWETMTELDYDSSIENYSLIDYFVQNSKTYEYKMIPCVQNFEGNGSSASEKASYFGVFLTGMYNGTLYNYPLIYDVKITDKTINTDKTYVKTLSSPYPAILGGKANYITMNVQANIISPTTVEAYGNVNMDAENSYREVLDAFLKNSMPKLVRNHSCYILGDVNDVKSNPISDDGMYGCWNYSMLVTETGSGDISNLIKNGLEYSISTS